MKTIHYLYALAFFAVSNTTFGMLPPYVVQKCSKQSSKYLFLGAIGSTATAAFLCKFPKIGVGLLASLYGYGFFKGKKATLGYK